MKTLEHTIRKELVEAYDVTKLELLVRLGLLPINSLPILKRALKRLQGGTMLIPQDRNVLGMLVDKMLSLTLSDPATFQRLRTAIIQHPGVTMESEIKEDSVLKKTPEGMLDTITRNIRTKLASGGHVSVTDKRHSSRAKAELRRRRDIRKKALQRKNRRNRMRESYDSAVKKVLSSHNIDNISSLSQDQAKQFFIQVETFYNSGE